MHQALKRLTSLQKLGGDFFIANYNPPAQPADFCVILCLTVIAKAVP